ncbi:MAG: 30S ribosomal protein S8 [Gammaproteobacteria bacterium]|nr:30S ribosomal protein S8 [Gammaproteobacteria bacterium]
MSLQDPIADMLSRILNAQARMRREVSMPASKMKAALLTVLKDEGYIADFRVTAEDSKKKLTVELKYFEGKPVIERLQRVSRPGLRRYRPKGKLPRVLNGLGTAIISTPNGLLTDRAARQQGVGGEILCIVS